MEDGAAGLIASVQRYSLHNGPGIRTTVFLKGCPLSCGWCHNPEARRAAPEVWLVPGRCVACGACVAACATGAASGAGLDRARCVRCGTCAEICPAGARERVGRRVDAAILVGEVARDSPFFEQSGGGVTFSGGEPLAQPEFLTACLRASRAAGIPTAVDTSGCADRDVLLAVAPWTDLFLFDLKLADDERHARHTGVAAAPLLENLRALDAGGAEIWLRVPLVPGVNDDEANLEAIGRIAAGLSRTRRLHLLPYHATARGKWARLGVQEPAWEFRVPPAGRVAAAAALLARHGLDVHVGG
jgi:pyruvate formate lyase activating enzyme